MYKILRTFDIDNLGKTFREGTKSGLTDLSPEDRELVIKLGWVKKIKTRSRRKSKRKGESKIDEKNDDREELEENGEDSS